MDFGIHQPVDQGWGSSQPGPPRGATHHCWFGWRTRSSTRSGMCGPPIRSGRGAAANRDVGAFGIQTATPPSCRGIMSGALGAEREAVLGRSRYDEIGRGYTSTRAADARIVLRLIDLLGLSAGVTICDVGAGSGNYANALADRGYRILAVEPSATMARQARPHKS